MAAEAQDYLCGLAARYRAIADRVIVNDPTTFSWVYGRAVV